MTRRLSRNSLLGVVVLVLLTPILIQCVVSAAQAQTTGVEQRSPQNVIAPAQSGRNGPGAIPTDASPLIFYLAGAYGSGGYLADALALGDVNGDGRPDMVVANQNSKTVTVLLGNGDGTFRGIGTYGSGGGTPMGVAIGDVNGDGRADVAVADYPAGVSVLLGNGDGTLQPAVNYSAGGDGAYSVAIADLNGDGSLDLVVTNDLSDTVGVLLSNGDGTFQPAVSYNSGADEPRSVAIGDLNGDSHLDLVVTDLADPESAVSVLLGNGDGTFRAPVTYGTGDWWDSSVAIGDFNGDGHPDLAVGTFSMVDVFLGNGNGTFQAPVSYEPGGSTVFSVAVGDVNADGHADLVVLNWRKFGTHDHLEPDGVVGVLLGNGDGTFQSVVAYSSGGFGGAAVALGDVNGDGKPDVLAANGCSIKNRHCERKSQGVIGVLLNSFGNSPTTTSLVSSLNPAGIQEFVYYTASVTAESGGTLTGSVLFQDGGSTVATVALAGNTAQYRAYYRTAGAHPMTAIYSSDAKNASSQSSVLIEYVGGPVPSKTRVTTSGSPSLIGQPVTFTATVTSKYGAPFDGELVTFSTGDTVLGSAGLAGGIATFTTSTLSAGHKYVIKESYVGDAIWKPSSGTVKQVVVKYSTTTTLTSSQNPSAKGQAVTFTATVSCAGPMPTGQVNFLDGKKSLGGVSLSGSVAELTTSKLAVGTHPITAEYLGDANTDKSTSPVLDQVVQ